MSKKHVVITPTTVRIRSLPNINSETVGFLHNEDIVDIDEIKNGWAKTTNKTWIKIEDGESKLKETKSKRDMEAVSATQVIVGTAAVTTNIVTKISGALRSSIVENFGSENDDYRYGSYDSSVLRNLITKNMNGIFGLPYQFSSDIDRRLQNTTIGRKYAKKIIGAMPLLFLSPGKCNFMQEFDEDDKISAINTMLGGDDDVDIDNVVTKYGRYYSFEYDYVGYYSFVNKTLRSLAYFMGIADREITIGRYTQRLGLFDWKESLNIDFKSMLAAEESIPFYLDSDTSISENFTNNTTESQLSQKANSLSDMAREISFVLGDQAGIQFASIDQSGSDELVSSEFQEFAQQWGEGSSILDNLTSELTTVATGGKLIFPEIWSDSDFSRSYNINFKFRSPDADALSIYLNNYVPVIHLVGFAAPHQISANGYSAPYIVRGGYKGFFNCDMGMVTGLDITRGREGGWNANGLPTAIDVSMTIKDLYSSMFLSKTNKYLLSNTSLLDYLCAMAGMNINKPDITRMPELWGILAGGSITDIPNNIWTNIQQDLSNELFRIYKR